MTRVETIAEGITLYLGDCREILPTLPRPPVIVADPPYGLGAKWTGGKDVWPLHHKDGMEWDSATENFVLRLPELADQCVIWGGHLYELPPVRGWLVWDKTIRKFTAGHCELAWTTLDQPIRAFSLPTISLITGTKILEKTHPTQKPLELMVWCLDFIKPKTTIVDPFMGSGTTGVAAVKLGHKFTGIEIEPKYFDMACRRVRQAVDTPDMFVETPAPLKQEALEL